MVISRGDTEATIYIPGKLGFPKLLLQEMVALISAHIASATINLILGGCEAKYSYSRQALLIGNSNAETVG
jgi:hypothetical protein